MAKLVYLSDVEHDPETVLTVGTFDGVHVGHRRIIRRVLEKAEKKDLRSVIVTFDPHPRNIIDPGSDGIRLLTTLTERCQLLEEIGIHEMVVIPFDRDFSLKSSEAFIRDVLYRNIGISEFVIGYDHHFGKDREGTIDTVKRMGNELDFSTEVVSRKDVNEKPVSSTAIRNALIEEGDIKQAKKFLGRAYRLTGTVVQGARRGKKLGFPTANIKPDHEQKAIPKAGVYAVRGYMDQSDYGGMMNIGTRPTFEKESEPVLEVHLFDFNRNIYGKTIQIEFLDRIRSEKRFDSKEELINQIQQDKKIAENINKSYLR